MGFNIKINWVGFMGLRRDNAGVGGQKKIKISIK